MTAGRAHRSVNAEQAVAEIADNSRVFVSGGAAAPLSVVDALAADADRWCRLETISDRLIEPLATFASPGQPFHHITLQPSPAVDGIRTAGALIEHPVPFSTFGATMAADAAWPIDAAIVQVSRPGPDGRVSLGVSVATPLGALDHAPLVIAEINQQMPYTFGDGELTLDRFDLVVEADHPLVELVRPTPGNTARTIGALVADTIVNGATLQLGIGALADAVLASLGDHRGLNVHSGMISDGIVELDGTGALDGVTHPLHPGRIVTGLVGGKRLAFDFVDRNERVFMAAASLSHGHDVLTRLPRFTAINSAVEVDLTGAINGETIGDRVVSGPGGAPDYGRAAAAAVDGRFIVALPSTAAGGSKSRIVSQLDRDGRITVPGHHVTTVVTEHGVAELADLEDEARAEALRAIAAPDLADQYR